MLVLPVHLEDVHVSVLVAAADDVVVVVEDEDDVVALKYSRTVTAVYLSVLSSRVLIGREDDMDQAVRVNYQKDSSVAMGRSMVYEKETVLWPSRSSR